MQCRRCGTQLRTGATFCTKCGTFVDPDEVPQQQAVPNPLPEKKHKFWPYILICALIALAVCAVLFIPRVHRMVFGADPITSRVESIELQVGETYDLREQINAGGRAEGELFWSSSNGSIATVSDDGMVTAVGAGTCEIKVRDADDASAAAVTVTVAEAEAAETPDTEAEPEPVEVPGDTNVKNVSADNGGVGGDADTPWNTMTDGDYLVSIRRLNAYSGPFVEDQSDDEVSNVLALQFRNDSEQDLQYAEYVFDVDGRELVFKLSNLPAGASCVVLEASRHPYRADEVLKLTSRLVTNVDTLSSAADQILIVDNGDNSITVMNLTDQPITVARVFFKTYYPDQDTFIGGITYMVELKNIPANGSSEPISPTHYDSKYSVFTGSGVYDS